MKNMKVENEKIIQYNLWDFFDDALYYLILQTSFDLNQAKPKNTQRNIKGTPRKPNKTTVIADKTSKVDKLL